MDVVYNHTFDTDNSNFNKIFKDIIIDKMKKEIFLMDQAVVMKLLLKDIWLESL